jgi:starch synthase
LQAYRNPVQWQELIRNAMQRDFSWDASAAEYSALYRRIAG